MAREAKREGKGVPAILLIGGAAAAVAAVLYFATRAKAAPPPPPPPGLANLYGKVTDAESGRPLSGVLVSLDGMTAYTDGSGNYVLTEIQPGGYTATFSKEGYETAVY